jgi:ABC-2 type transport system permease protein
MKTLAAALWAEMLKARRSRISLASAVVFAIFPLVGGLFMIILRDPEAARSMGLIGAKAQLTAGTADWPSFFGVLLQALAMAGPILFAFVVAWIFGREFSDRTVKDLLALPTPRGAIVAAKFALAAAWTLGLTLLVFALGLGVGAAVDIPGWSPGLAWSTFGSVLAVAALTFALMPFVALFAGIGHGYLAALGWALLSFVLSQIVSILGWGGWVPWSLPVLRSGMMGSQGLEQIGPHSYLLALLAFVGGLAATWTWWRDADQVR